MNCKTTCRTHHTALKRYTNKRRNNNNNKYQSKIQFFFFLITQSHIELNEKSSEAELMDVFRSLQSEKEKEKEE